MFKSYVYLLKEKGGLFYIGSRKSSYKDLIYDFWKYGTSSSKKKEILNNKENFKVKILKTFKTYKEALKFESLLHKKYNVKENKKYFNKSNALEFSFDSNKTISCYDTISKKNIRIREDIFYNNLNRYKTFSTGKVTVRFKEGTEFFNITVEEYKANKDLYITSSGNGVLCRHRGTDENYFKLPKEFYNKIEFETPAEVRRRYPKNFIAVRIKGENKTIYINSSEYNPEIHSSPGTRTLTKEGKKDKLKVLEFNIEKYKLPKKTLNPRVKVLLNGKEITLMLEEYRKLKELKENVEWTYNTNKGSVPVKNRETGERYMVSKEEFYKNRQKYETFGLKRKDKKNV